MILNEWGGFRTAPFLQECRERVNMKALKIADKEYVLEFTFEAAEHKNLVQSMFNIMSGAYIVKNEDEANAANAMINGVAEMVADIPRICRTAFYAGLLENNTVSEEDAKKLMKQYMKENQLSYKKLFENLKECMEDDGFFELSGLEEMMQEIWEKVEEKNAEKTNQNMSEQTSTE